jgi:PAS domain S-box-containing protein
MLAGNEYSRNQLIKQLDILQVKIDELHKLESSYKRTERSLRESEEKYKQIAENSLDGVGMIQEGKLIYLNAAFFKMFGYKKRELINKPLTILFTPQDSKKLEIRAIKRLNSDRNPNRYEFTGLRKDGTRLNIEVSTSKTFTYNNKSTILTVLREVSANKRAEEALRESEERFRSIAEESFDIIFRLDVEGIFTYISPSAKTIIGYEPNELIGKPLENYLTGTEIKKIEGAVDRLIEEARISSFELEVKSKNGELKSFEINANSIIKDDNIIGYQGIARDITARKRSEEEMKKTFMKFKIDEGNLYLIKEVTPTISNEAFADVLKVGYSGLYISRTPKTDFKEIPTGDVEFLWLAENGGENTIVPKINKIEKKIMSLSNRKIIYIDRLDYLIFKNNIKQIINFIQRLHELAIIYRHIIVLSLDPSTVSARELQLIEKETCEIEPMYASKLSEPLIEILKFTYSQNNFGIKPSYTAVGTELGLCKPTVRKRIRQLISGGYVIENINGRRKLVEITERGKNIFLK